MSPRQKLLLGRAGVVCAILLSLWLRVAYAWQWVFTPWGVDFQEPDAWFHLRTAHNLLAHFPFRSGFDPYALFPGGMNVPTGPLWDYMIASSAWLAGRGSPSPALTDHLAAWLPAILGALCPIPVFWVSRRLFGLAAAVFAALWMAVNAGEFLWLTHLGNADHHAAEGFFSILVFSFLCAAADSPASRWPPVLAGLSLGALLATQPGALFVPGILAAVAMIEPSLAAAILICCGTAAVFMLPWAGTVFSGYDWVSLAAGATTAAAVCLIEYLRKRRGYAPAIRWLAAAIGLLFALGVVALTQPALIRGLTSEFGVLKTTDVAELKPIFAVSRPITTNLGEMTLHLGTVWFLALPGLPWLAVLAFRRRWSALTLLTVFSVVSSIAALLLMRTILYWAPFAAIIAGAVCAWVTRIPNAFRFRAAVGAALAALLIAGNIPLAIRKMSFPTAGAGRDWFEALVWLRVHSSEPFGEANMWDGYFPLKAGRSSSVRSPAYGIATWWDTGYIVENLSRRVPMINGFAAGTDETATVQATRDMAAFYSGTFSDSAVNLVRSRGVRYVLVDARVTANPAIFSRTTLPAMRKITGGLTRDVFGLMWQRRGGTVQPLVVYLEDYYRTMGVRLYLSDGEAVRGTGPWVLKVEKDSGGRPTITGSLHFSVAREAGEDISAHGGLNFIAGCLYPVVICFDVEAVRGLRRVFTSGQPSTFPERSVNAVKIFEVEPEPAVRSR